MFLVSAVDSSHNIQDGKERTKEVILGDVKFESIISHEKILKGLNKCGFVYLSTIQAKCLPLGLIGNSMVIESKSGTGKTLIFSICAINQCLVNNRSELQCVILAPTREIAVQIAAVIHNIGCYVEDLDVKCFIGGTDINDDIEETAGCNIAIGTPGRINELFNRNALKGDTVKLLVLDEADVFCCKNSRFRKVISKIVNNFEYLDQVIASTATVCDGVNDFMERLVSDVKTVKMDIGNNQQFINATIAQYFAPVYSDQSAIDVTRTRDKLIQVIKNCTFDQCFIFVNYLTAVRSICNLLNANGLPSTWISSEQDQSVRVSIINSMKDNRCKILVSTDLAARGIDVPNVNLVINLNLPFTSEIYIHRMGRAGRFGLKGHLVTIALEPEIDKFKEIVQEVITDEMDIPVLPIGDIEGDIFEYDISKFEMMHCVPHSKIKSELKTSSKEKKLKKSNKKKASRSEKLVNEAVLLKVNEVKDSLKYSLSEDEMEKLHAFVNKKEGSELIDFTSIPKYEDVAEESKIVFSCTCVDDLKKIPELIVNRNDDITLNCDFENLKTIVGKSFNESDENEDILKTVLLKVMNDVEKSNIKDDENENSIMVNKIKKDKPAKKSKKSKKKEPKKKEPIIDEERKTEVSILNKLSGFMDGNDENNPIAFYEIGSTSDEENHKIVSPHTESKAYVHKTNPNLVLPGSNKQISIEEKSPKIEDRKTTVTIKRDTLSAENVRSNPPDESHIDLLAIYREQIDYINKWVQMEGFLN